MPAAAHRDEQALNELCSFGIRCGASRRDGRRACGAKAANFGFLGVIWGLGNDLTTAVGIVRITAGSVPLGNSLGHEYCRCEAGKAGVGLSKVKWLPERELRW